MHQDDPPTDVVGKGGNSCLSLVPSQVPHLSLVNGFRPEVVFPLVISIELPADFFGPLGMEGSALATVIMGCLMP